MMRPAIMAMMVFGALSTTYAYADQLAQPQHAEMAQQNSRLSADEQKMLIKLAQGNMAEVATAELAQTKSAKPEVLTFAKKMIDDHSKALKDIQQLADDKKVELPKAADAKHADALKKMNALSPAEFDRQYMSKAGVEDHKETLKLLKDIQSKAKDADFKALAKKMEPTVKGHLEMAQNAPK